MFEVGDRILIRRLREFEGPFIIFHVGPALSRNPAYPKSGKMAYYFFSAKGDVGYKFLTLDDSHRMEIKKV